MKFFIDQSTHGASSANADLGSIHGGPKRRKVQLPAFRWSNREKTSGCQPSLRASVANENPHQVVPVGNPHVKRLPFHRSQRGATGSPLSSQGLLCKLQKGSRNGVFFLPRLHAKLVNQGLSVTDPVSAWIAAKTKVNEADRLVAGIQGKGKAVTAKE
jgi:hypothetical protein